MTPAPNRARINAITSTFSAATWARTSGVEAGGNSFLAACDQATLAAIYAVGAAFGLASHQAT